MNRNDAFFSRRASTLEAQLQDTREAYIAALTVLDSLGRVLQTRRHRVLTVISRMFGLPDVKPREMDTLLGHVRADLAKIKASAEASDAHEAPPAPDPSEPSGEAKLRVIRGEAQEPRPGHRD